MSEKSNLTAVLSIKDCTGQKIKKYRILEESTGNLQDVPVQTIAAAISKGTTVNNLFVENGKIVETTPIKSIPELKWDSISLEDWCKEHGERGQRILTEFNNGNNFYILPKDISSSSNLKLGFRCTTCKKINIQTPNWKTAEKSDSKCKYCANQGEEKAYSLLNWCNNNGEKGKKILQEYLSAPNEITPDKIAYSSHRKVNFRCLKCGAINEQIVNNKTSKNNIGCKYCNTKSTSYPEQLIYLFLRANGLETYNRYKLHEKEFDIFLPQLNLLIEHQSSLHRTISCEINDQFGGYEAQSLGLQLLEVCCIDNKYQRQPSLNCIIYERDNEQEMIQQLVVWLYQNYNIQLNMNLYTRQLEDEAYLASCKVKYEDSLAYKKPDLCKEWNQQLNGRITPDKVAANSRRKYYWRCKVCNHVWVARVDSRNNMGTGCPNYRQHKHFQ